MSLPPRASAERTETVIQGGFRVSDDEGLTLSTILGSCVSVCLHDPDRAIGGMNHYLLARGSSDDEASLRYGAHAMELLINGLLKGGARRDRLVAKVFGGARITRAYSDIGAANAAFARDYLAHEGIPCLTEHLGGDRARRLQFRPANGMVRMMTVPNDAVAPEVQPLAARVPPPEQAITLF